MLKLVDKTFQHVSRLLFPELPEHGTQVANPGCVDSGGPERQDNIIGESLIPVLWIATREARAHQPFRSREISASLIDTRLSLIH